MTQTPLTTGELVPSELAWLSGDQFAGKKTFNDWETTILGSDAKVSVKQLAGAVAAAALLAAEQAGAIRLEVRAKKTLFGLRSVTTLYAVPGDVTANWPEHTLEARVAPLARQLQANKDKHEVDRIIHDLLSEDVGNPWGELLDMVGAGLESRNLLESQQVKKLKVFNVAVWALPERTSAILAEQTAAGVRQLVADAEKNRPEVWKLLTDKIQSGLKSRVESDSGSGSDSSSD